MKAKYIQSRSIKIELDIRHEMKFSGKLCYKFVADNNN